LAFDSNEPVAPVHVLIIPKKPIASVADMEAGDELLIGKIIYRAKLLAEELGVDYPGYKLNFNVRSGGGQSVNYLHLHLVGGGRVSGAIE
jgi:histidine triad (HIT) family protein